LLFKINYVRHHKQTAVALIWTIESQAPTEDVEIIVNGVLAYGRAQATDGNAEAISCLVRDAGYVVAGGSGRTEYRRLFVNHLWVAQQLRGQGIGTRVLLELEAVASQRGCQDAIIETLDDSVAAFYTRLGYGLVALVPRYVGPFNRHIMRKPSLTAAR
jgi:GNAT superfamily N-acetyltransferase